MILGVGLVLLAYGIAIMFVIVSDTQPLIWLGRGLVVLGLVIVALAAATWNRWGDAWPRD